MINQNGSANRSCNKQRDNRVTGHVKIAKIREFNILADIQTTSFLIHHRWKLNGINKRQLTTIRRLMKWEFENSGDITENPEKRIMSWYTCQAPLNENRNEKSGRQQLTRSENWKKAVLNQNSSTQTGTGEAKKLFEEKYGWQNPLQRRERKPVKRQVKQFELKKIKQQEAMLTASWKTYTNHTQSKNQ